MTSHVGVSARSDIGAVRHVNEDGFLAEDPVFVVADGMGGHARGDLASQTAVESLARTLQPGSRPTPDEVVAAIDEANAAVRALSGVDESGAAVAGTTLAGVVRVRVPERATEQWMVVNVGDSRVYAWDGTTLTQLTVDHSAVQELVDAGLITEAQAAVHPERNIITRALGAEDFVDTDTELLPDAQHRVFVICSDGLTRELSDSRIAAILAEQPDDPAGELVEAAVEAGGHDNVTVLVIAADEADGPSVIS
ncbi:PP2C family protein-serine/threonine phosphatase [Leifsonia aquatica]|jgi:serine/threonine protein phosphatase PrpC|uniref:Serine/threonine protein phosphatase PrpC n=2 Tax=Leifsonia aquatica TaxID=144185 RepID=A0A7W4YIR5_LEIAQ|nr:protein phosphatase 2C domain-containing protein [Leifsonia aquatica]ERK70997.1 putative serine/threonine phosphatase stp [Leifsonia aquatica ATCC 14665]MBB2966095.1 serine/threonine protein phosphatase PrpC [Leifsonia aquatica]